jgi:hypothetical protein
VPYTDKEQTILTSLIKQHGQKKGHDIFNRMRAQGDLGPDSKERMERRAAESRRNGASNE